MVSLTKKLSLAAALSVGALAATPASAAVTICFGSGQQCAPQTQEQVLLTGGSNLTTVISNFNGSPAQTGIFTSSSDTLNADASGQAVITANQGLLNQLSYATINGITFTVATFNVNGANGTTGFIYGVDAGGDAFSRAFTLGPGSNFMGIVADGGDVLTGFSLQSEGGMEDVRQVRLGGIGRVTAPVPEPGTWAMMLLGFGAIGVATRRRRSRALIAQMA